MIKELFQKYGLLESIYPVARIVDPKGKKVIEYFVEEGLEVPPNIQDPCFHFWPDQDACANCTSMRAINENETFIKLELKEDQIFMVTSLPVNTGESQYVLELIKDVTASGLVNEMVVEEQHKLQKMIDAKNELLITDPLTQIYNRRFIDERLPYEWIMNENKQPPLAVVMSDIDFFKKVNDAFGHAAGDFILKEFARILQKHMKDGKSWVARYGGEEFLMLLKEMPKEGIPSFLSTIKEEIAAADFNFEGQIIRITASFGASFSDEGETIEAGMHLADERLYEAKKTGRNKIVWA